MGMISKYPVDIQVRAERDRQDIKWGQQNHPDGTDESWGYQATTAKRENDWMAQQQPQTNHWLGILKEEVYEAFAETDPARLREELVQVAAVAVAWIEAIDRR